MVAGRPRTKTPLWKVDDIEVATRQHRLMNLVRPHLKAMTDEEVSWLSGQCGCTAQTLHNWSSGRTEFGGSRIMSAMLDVLGYLDRLPAEAAVTHRFAKRTAELRADH